MKRREFLTQVGQVAVGATAVGTAASLRASEAGESFCFCVAADPHCNEGVTAGLDSLGTGADRFRLVLARIADLPAADRPDFLIVNGDLQLRHFLPLLKDVRLPLHVTAGNHESTAADRRALREAFPADFVLNGTPSDYYSFVHKGVRFISACSAGLGGEHIGTFASENIVPRGQYEWLERELTAGESRKVLFTHIPVEPDGQDREMHISRNDSRWLNGLVRTTSPSAVFFGHLHRPTSERRVGPTAVWQVRSCCWNFDRAPIGFLHVRVHAGGLTVREILTGHYTPAA